MKVKGAAIFKKHGPKGPQYGENPFSISFEQSVKEVKQNSDNSRTFFNIDDVEGSLPLGHVALNQTNLI